MATYNLTTQIVPIISTNDIINCPYSGKKKIIKLPAGTYKLECWGAQGGSYNTNYGGAGGYSVGTITLNTLTTVYLYAGGQPTVSGDTSTIAQGGFNGGGSARYHSYSGTTSPCQAGGGASDIRIGTDSLYARVIVAGGGGGAAAVSRSDLTIKYGGGAAGGSAQSGYGATQTAPGTNGKFGVGADGYITGYNYKYASGGGGGGWYGGGASNQHSDSTDYTAYNGGGSGYVYTSSTASNYPSGCLLATNHQLSSASTLAGNTSFTSPAGSSETGHTGNGYVRITATRVTTSGGGTALRSYDITTTTLPNKLAMGDVLNCPYTGTMKSITLPKGKYVLECWGSRGGGSQDGNASAGKGGSGGYSIGTLELKTQTNLYCYAGGIGAIGYNSLSKGGFNGGGSAYGSSDSEPGCGGGGASDIRIGTDSLYARVIVAGGGGGGGEDSADTVGAGGGTSGSTGGNSIAATQTGGGDFGKGRHAYDGGGGGGGWYGGQTVSNLTSEPTTTGSDNQGGNGGSGYVYTSSTASNYPSGCLLNSDYYLTNASTTIGTASIISPTGTAETGHTSSGYVRIHVLETAGTGPRVNVNGTWKKSTGTYVKVNNTWKEVSDIYVKVNGVWMKQ